MIGKSSRSGSEYIKSQLVIVTLLIAVFSAILFSYSDVLANKTDAEVLAVTSSTVKHKVNYITPSDPVQPKVVNIKRGEYVYRVLTSKSDIWEILKDNGIQVNKNERVVCNTDTVRNGSVISLVTTETVLKYKQIEIPFTTQTVKTDLFLKGETHVVQKGIPGIIVQKIESYYEDGMLVKESLLEETTKSLPVEEIVEVGTAGHSLDEVAKKGYNCPYWHSVVDSGPYTDEEKRWLKFVMYCESGCNAESTKGSYKGLFQWSPYWWSKQFKENIFDGHAQIKHTIYKYRFGESTRSSQWPVCNARYVAKYGSN